MSQKGISAVSLILVVLVIIIVAGGVYISKKANPDQIFQRSTQEKIKYEQRKKALESQNENPAVKNSLLGGAASLSNPASEYCLKVGGTLQPQIRDDGGEYSLCQFPGDQACEEWALYRKNCPIGGIKTIGYDTPEEVYCVLVGGKTTATANSNCTLPDGNVCSNSDLYNGKCQ